MTKPDKLKACPFCDGKKFNVDPCDPDNNTDFNVVCQGQECLVSNGFYDTKQAAIDAWNTRTPDPMLAELVEKLRGGHSYCEDSWYSCPKAEDGCANEGEGSDCNCGVDRNNAIIDEILSRLAPETKGK